MFHSLHDSIQIHKALQHRSVVYICIMRIQSYDILPSLQPYVKLICTMECDEDADTSCIRVLPDTCAEIFFNYTIAPVAIINEELYKRSIATFRMSKPANVQMRKGTGVIAICFHPGMAYRFMDVPMHQLANKTIGLAELWGSLAAELEDKLAMLSNNEARVKLLQSYLVKKMDYGNYDMKIACCLQQVRFSGGMIPIEKLAADLGISQRHLSRKFQECVGLSTKEYQRVFRFIESLGRLKRHSAKSLTEVAYESGYYDQAHFIRDYKEYTGYTPRQVVLARHILY